MIYHVTRKADWEKALLNGYFEAASLHTEGFIHASSVTQITGVLERYYENEKELMLLHIDEGLLTSPVKYELARSVDQVFPHIFGPVNMEAIIKTEEI